MANHVKVHGLEIANGADIKNLVVEQLATDPAGIATAGRVWFNTASKTWKISTLDAENAVIVKSFHTLEEFNTFVSSLNNTTTGSTLVGYAGHTGANSQFSLTAGSLKNALDAIAVQLDTNTQSIVDIGSGNLVAMQTEIDTTQTGAGLSETGTYVVPTTSNYLNSSTSLANADAALDAAIKAEVDARVAAVSAEATARSDADALIVTNLSSTEAGKGAATVGVQDVDDNFTATTVEGVLAELQDNIEAEIAALSMQAVYDTSVADANGEVVVKLVENKSIKFLDNDTGETYLKIDPDGENPIKVSLSGPVNVSGNMSITGNLTVSGTTTEITSTVTSSDHFVLRPEGTVAAIAIEPGTSFTGSSILSIKAANGGAAVVSMGTDGVFNINKISNATSAIFNGAFEVGAAGSVNFNAVVLNNVGAGVADTDAVNVGQLNAAISSGNSTQSELDTTQAAAGLAIDGTYVVPTTSNYLNNTTTLAGADAVLDGMVFAVTGAAGINSNGTYTADATTNYLTTATSLTDADKKLDAQVKTLTDAVAAGDAALRTAINNLKYSIQSAAAAVSHTITHGLNSAFVNYTVLVEGDDGKYRNDIVAVTEVDNNNLLIELVESRKIKVMVEKIANI